MKLLHVFFFFVDYIPVYFLVGVHLKKKKTDFAIMKQK